MKQPFITYREQVDSGELAYFILQRAYPNYIGCLVAYPIEKSIINTPIAGYHLYITFDGVLAGNYIPAYKDVYDEIQSVFMEMARWYLSNRIMIDEKKYKKWKLNVSSAP